MPVSSQYCCVLDCWASLSCIELMDICMVTVCNVVYDPGNVVC